MKYIRTKDGIILNPAPLDCGNNEFGTYMREDARQADTIGRLCDEFVLFRDNKPYAIVPNEEHNAELAHDVWKDYRGAIWTDKGLIYVAKTNDKGELELL